MAVAVVVADNIRLNDADDVTVGTWVSPGGGAGAVTEPDVFLQGAAAISRKISAAGRGIYYTNGTTIDMTAINRRHMMFKVIITNPNAMPTVAAGGLYIWIGDDDTNNYRNVYFGSDAYPIKGGWVIVPFAPGSSWATTSGTPSALTAVDSFGIQCDAAFSATAKAENVVIDAIDIGLGLDITGGTGADPAANFQDLIDFDQGTTANRFGYVTEDQGIISVFGRIGIGLSVAPTLDSIHPTRFEDDGKILLFPDGLFEQSFSGLDIHTGTGSTSTSSNIRNCTFIGVSTGGGSVDTRPDFILEGTVGVATFFNCVFERVHDFNEKDSGNYEVESCTFEDIEIYEHRGGTITNTKFVISSNNSPNIGMMTSFSGTGNISNTTFETLGSSGHAIDIKTAGTYSFVGNQFTNFGGTGGSNTVENSGDSNAAILNSSGGLVTINVSGGGNQPSIRNTGTGSTTIVNANVTVNIQGLPNTVGAANSTEIRVFDRSQIDPVLGITTTEIAGTENHVSGDFTFSVGAGTTFDIRVLNLDYIPVFISNQTASTDPTNIPVDLKIDRVYDDDTPPSGG